MDDLTAESKEPVNSEKTRVSLIAGFLGAGKTTFIKSRLDQPGERTAVLVNEFGSLGFDGEILHQTDGIEVMELPGGCVCCSQQLQLAEAVVTLCRQFHPERLFIEPSGVAEASAVLQTLQQPELTGKIRLDGVITLIDAETFLEDIEPGVFGSFFRDQIVQADLILVNKVDLVMSSQVAKIEEKLSSLNPGALIATTTFAALREELPQRKVTRLGHSSSESLPWEHCCFEPTFSMTEKRLNTFGEQIVRGVYGRILRVKGILPVEGTGCLQFQAAGRRWRVMRLNKTLAPRLICIGFDLQYRKISDFFSIKRDMSNTFTQRSIATYELS